MIRDLSNDDLKGDKERIVSKLDERDGESTAEMLSDVLKILRLSKGAIIDKDFFKNMLITRLSRNQTTIIRKI